MKIKMLQTVNGKVNGIKMGPYTEGVEYDLDTERAQLFIGSAMAEEVVVAPPLMVGYINTQNIEDAQPTRRPRARPFGGGMQ